LYNHVSNEVHVLHSKVLNQDRRLYIQVPTLDSAAANTALPTLYLLDGENHFHLLAAYVAYLSHWQVIPPMIVVGIISVDRVKDLTPANSVLNFSGQVDSSYKTSGGNEPFLTFVQQELMPYVQAKYKTNSVNLLAGHSFGGITTLNCLLTRPSLFDAYIAVSPSLWFANKFVLRLARKNLPQRSLANKKLFYSVGNEGGSFRRDVVEFDRLVRKTRWKQFEHRYQAYPEESHMSEPLPAYYDALRFIYKDWKPDAGK
jgi:predicted alpha/beta superfamily hydrolase